MQSASKVNANPENIVREARLLLRDNSRYQPYALACNSVSDKTQVSAFLSKSRKLGGCSTLQPKVWVPSAGLGGLARESCIHQKHRLYMGELKQY